MAIGHETLGNGPGPEHNIVPAHVVSHAGGLGDIGEGFIHRDHFHIVQVTGQFHGALAGLGAADHEAKSGRQVVDAPPQLRCHQGFQAAFCAAGQL